MAILESWMNSNTLRSYPVDEQHPCQIPDDLIADMQVFVMLPRFSDNINESAEMLHVISMKSDERVWMPRIRSASVTDYMVTLVVECPGGKLFCTKSLSSVVPGEPVQFIAESNTCSGWLSFGNFDKSAKFSFSNKDDTLAGMLDPMAVVFLPPSTIGGLSVPAFSTKLSGPIKIVGGHGVNVSADEATNSIVLSLDDDLAPTCADPCDPEGSDESLPACGIAGVEPENGAVVLAFTGSPISAEKVNSIRDEVGHGAVDPGGLTAIATQRVLCGDDYIEVSVKKKGYTSFYITGYRLVYEIDDPQVFGLLRRDMEFSLDTGYHRPDYDIWTRTDRLPPLAELYREISNVEIPEPAQADQNAEQPDPSVPLWEFEDERHSYEMAYAKTSRYDIANGNVLHPDSSIENAQPPEDDSPSVFYFQDPYSIGVNDIKVESGRKIVFRHRISVSDLICSPENNINHILSIFVEIAYRPADVIGTNARTSVVRKQIWSSSNPGVAS